MRVCAGAWDDCGGGTGRCWSGPARCASPPLPPAPLSSSRYRFPPSNSLWIPCWPPAPVRVTSPPPPAPQPLLLFDPVPVPSLAPSLMWPPQPTRLPPPRPSVRPPPAPPSPIISVASAPPTAPLGPSDPFLQSFETLRETVRAAPPRSNITFRLKSASTILVDGGPLLVSSGIHVYLYGAEPSVLDPLGAAVIDAQSQSRIFSVMAGATVSLRMLHLMNGLCNVGSGGAIFTTGSIRLTDVNISNCHTTATANPGQPARGGAMHMYSPGHVMMLRCEVSGCSARNDEGLSSGGAIYVRGWTHGSSGPRGESASILNLSHCRIWNTSATKRIVRQTDSSLAEHQDSERFDLWTSPQGGIISSNGVMIAHNCKFWNGKVASIFEVQNDAMHPLYNAYGGAFCFFGNYHTAKVVACSISGSEAYHGGAVYMTGGTLDMSRSLLHDNAAGVGTAIYLGSGSATYVLPAPLGHWVAASACVVYRTSCDDNALTDLQRDACIASRKSCSLDLSDDNPLCREKTLSQPCDWQSQPWLLGTTVMVIPHGVVEGTFPFNCNPGVYGGTDNTTDQGTPTCSGRCVSGHI